MFSAAESRADNCRVMGYAGIWLMDIRNACEYLVHDFFYISADSVIFSFNYLARYKPQRRHFCLCRLRTPSSSFSSLSGNLGIIGFHEIRDDHKQLQRDEQW